jgi:hypothetical protein
MSRSVNYLNGALSVAYVETSDFCGCDEDCWYFFKESADDVAARLQERWPSFEAADRWDNRETRIVAENGLAVVGVSEYCGLTSVSIAVSERCERPELARAWIRRMASEFEKMFGTLRKLGTFSNGESVYERKVG